MANFYSNFSEIISDLTTTEYNWWKRELEIDPYEIEDREHEHWVAAHPYYEDASWPGFEWAFQEGDTQLWMHSEDSFSIEQLEGLCTDFLRQFRPQGIITIQWANTCSKPRIDSFSGSALYITAKETRSMHTAYWLMVQRYGRVRWWVHDSAPIRWIRKLKNTITRRSY